MEVQKRKVVIVGAGHVGSHAAYALLSQGLVDEIVFIDIDTQKAAAQALDLLDATVYLPTPTKVYAGDYDDSKDAQLLIVAAGPLPDQSKGQTRMDTLQQTISVMRDVTGHIGASGFGGIILNISNPADVVTHFIQHQLHWPANRIFSTSTALDSARLRRAIAQATGIASQSISAYVLGEHGESQMVPWSTVTIGATPLLQLMGEQPARYGMLNLSALADAAKQSGWNILSGKGSTEFGIGAAIAQVIRAIYHNENQVLPVSVLLRGEYGQQNVYASVPALINKDGIAGIIQLPLTPEEQQQFEHSCQIMRENFDLSLQYQLEENKDEII